MEKFVASKQIQCADCNKVLFSRYKGEIAKCDCVDYIFIEETDIYCTIGGISKKIIFLEERNIREVLRLAELDDIISNRMKSYYPDVKFKLTSVNPVTIYHNSFVYSDSDEMLKKFIEVAQVYCTEKEAYRLVMEYDLLDEVGF